MNQCTAEMEARCVQSPDEPGFHAVITSDQSTFPVRGASVLCGSPPISVEHQFVKQ